MNGLIPESKEVREHAQATERGQAMRRLEKRVRSSLRHGRLRLHKSRSERDKRLLGRYWVCDSLGVMPILRHVELPAMARQLRVWFGDLNVE